LGDGLNGGQGRQGEAESLCVAKSAWNSPANLGGTADDDDLAARFVDGVNGCSQALADEGGIVWCAFGVAIRVDHLDWTAWLAVNAAATDNQRPSRGQNYCLDVIALV
jgi:hypothetical protein